MVSGALLCVACGGGNIVPRDAPVAAGGRVLHARLYATDATSKFAGAAEFAGSIRIVNNGATAARVGVSIDGHLFRDRDEMLAYIAAIPPMFEKEPDYRKAWRFLTARAYFYTPYTGSDEAHDPLRFVNSIGYGYCDDFASVLATIWQWQGYESRVWWMTGHVVPEIRVDDRWRMFDADMGVFYADSSGDPASVEELASDPQLILEPLRPMYDSSYIAYDPVVADIYASAGNNRADLPVTGESRGMQLDLPAGSEFVFPVADGADPSLFGDAMLSHPIYYGAQLRIPSVAEDTTLQLPLFVSGISGTGTVNIGEQSYEIGSSNLDARFGPFWVPDNHTEPVSTVTLRAGASNVVLRLSLSAFVVDGPATARVHILQQSGTPVKLTYTRSASPVKASEAEILSGADLQLVEGPKGYSSPRLVFSELARCLSQ